LPDEKNEVLKDQKSVSPIKETSSRYLKSGSEKRNMEEISSQIPVEKSEKNYLRGSAINFDDVELDYGRIFRWGTQETWNNLKTVLNELLNADIAITVMEIESSLHKILIKKIISKLDQLHEPHHPITPLSSQRIKESIHALYCEEEALCSGHFCMSALHQRWNGFNIDSLIH